MAEMNPNLEELKAQLEDHGVEKLEFYLENSLNTIFVVNNVKFEDDKIKVELSAEHY